MRDLIKAYNHEMKLFHFLAAKGLTRINPKEEKREEEQKRKEEEESKTQYDYYFQILDDVFVSLLCKYSFYVSI